MRNRLFTAPSSKEINSPLLDAATFDVGGNRLFTATYHTKDRWLLDEHRTKAGDAIVPGTGFIELAAQALQANGEHDAFEIRDLLFLRPLQVKDGKSREIQVTLARTDAGYKFDTRSDCEFDGRKGHLLNAQASLNLVPLRAVKPLDLMEIFSRCGTEQSGDGLKSPQEAHLMFGSRWRVLQRLAYGNSEGIAELALPEEHRGDIAQGFLLHPALLDLATGWAMKLISGYRPTHLWVPVSYDVVRVFGPLPTKVFSWVRSAADNTSENSVAVFDVTVCDAQGNVYLEIEGFSIKRLDAEVDFAKSLPLRSNEVTFVEDSTGPLTPLSTAEQRLQHNVTQGIRPQEGAAAFNRAIETGLSQIVVSSLDLKSLERQAIAASNEPQSTGQKFERPELDTDYTEPSSDIERTLVGFWSELLGVERVGVNDSFFDLGGHSLIAVRLFAMVKKAYRIEFPISILFEAPTIANCAKLIAEKVGPVTLESGEKPEAEPTATHRYTHLVAMHNGEGGTRVPFFLVAGMFGNVLNLRHLAHLLGADRPFYGMQARGLFGDAEPHSNLIEAAADYIVEIRSVQPHGPYLLGGFSGGGIIAYEIARQLEAAGDTVSLLAMLDTPLPQRRPLTRLDRSLIHWQELKKNGIAYPVKWAAKRIKWELARRRRVVEEPNGAAHEFHDTAIEAAFLQSLETYQMKPWSGSLVLLRPPLVGHWKVSGGQWIDSQRAYVFDDNDWSSLAPDIRVFEVPGNHDSMVLEPNVRVLAARMKSCIKAAESKFAGVQNSKPSSAFDKAAE